jgi:type II secretory pathway pseudopilin PulG
MALSTVHNRTRFTKGFSIVEIVVAVGIFSIIAAGIVGLYLSGLTSSRNDLEDLKADLYLQESLEAMRSIRDYSFANLTNGTHGLSKANGYWELSGSSDSSGIYTRNIVVEDVQRAGAGLVTNSDCSLTTGGLTDTQAKKVTATVSWTPTVGTATSISSIAYMNKWKDQTGCGEASWLSVDTSAVTLAAGNRQIEGILVTNSGATDITIIKILPTWENSENITEVKMEDARIWKSTGGYTPDGAQPSGVELDVDDYLLSPTAGTPEVNKIRFDGSMENTAFTLTFEMSDNTKRYIESFSPSATCPAQADNLTINTGAATFGGSQNKQLQGITVENTTADPLCEIRIDTVTLTWTNGEQIDKVQMDGGTKWAWNGAGTPDGKQDSGTELDMDDLILEVSAGTYDIDYFQFTGTMTGDTFDITFKMNDETTKVISDLSP